MTRELDHLLTESLWIRRLAKKLVRSAHEAEDLSQEVLVKALEHAPANGGPRLQAWLATVTRNLATQRGLRERSRPHVEAEAAQPEAYEDDSVERLALHAHLTEAVRSLPANQREVVFLRYFDDLPPR